MIGEKMGSAEGTSWSSNSDRVWCKVVGLSGDKWLTSPPVVGLSYFSDWWSSIWSSVSDHSLVLYTFLCHSFDSDPDQADAGPVHGLVVSVTRGNWVYDQLVND